MTTHAFENRFAAQGRLRWQVVDSCTGKVVRESDGWIKNLILNIGLDEVATRSFISCMTYAVAGTGTTPTADDSGATTAAQAGTGVTLTGGTFTFTDTATDAGKVIKWDTGEEATIVTVSTPTSVTVANSATVTDGVFTTYRTNQNALTSEVKRTNTYLTSGGGCGTTIVGNTAQNQRTYDFTAESGTVNYTEIGFSWASSGGTNLFSRILLPAPVTVLNLQQLRIVYQLWITVTPATPSSTTASISGWSSTTGVEQVAGVGLIGVNSSTGAASTLANGGGCNEPSQNVGTDGVVGWLSTDSAAPAAFNVGDSRTTNGSFSTANSLGTYVAGTYTRTKTFGWALNGGNRADWRSMGYGYYNTPSSFPYTSSNNCFVFVFDSAQEKLNTHTLTLAYRWTWSRVLS